MLSTDGEGDKTTYALLATRLVMGWIFFYSGFSKLVEDGLAYGYASTYLSEAVPLSTPEITLSLPGLVELPLALLANAVAIPLEPFFSLLASFPYIGTLVVLSEILFGLAILLGGLTRLTGLGAGFMMLMFYFGNAEWSHGLINGDFLYMFLYLVLACAAAGRYKGIDARLHERYGDRYDWLKYLG